MAIFGSINDANPRLGEENPMRISKSVVVVDSPAVQKCVLIVIVDAPDIGVFRANRSETSSSDSISLLMVENPSM